jgi:hypothetical protein
LAQSTSETGTNKTSSFISKHYDEDDENSGKEGEEKQEEQTGEITTTNKVF